MFECALYMKCEYVLFSLVIFFYIFFFFVLGSLVFILSFMSTANTVQHPYKATHGTTKMAAVGR